MQHLSPAPIIDSSLSFLVGAFLCLGLAVFATRASDLSLDMVDDDVKVEAARFTHDPQADMDIFAAGCEAKAEKSCSK